jgi:hypothetical protein
MGITCGRSTSKMMIAGLTTGHEKISAIKPKSNSEATRKRY